MFVWYCFCPFVCDVSRPALEVVTRGSGTVWSRPARIGDTVPGGRSVAGAVSSGDLSGVVHAVSASVPVHGAVRGAGASPPGLPDRPVWPGDGPAAGLHQTTAG